MATLSQIKELSQADTPILLFDCQLADGSPVRWSTHSVTHNGVAYEARVLRSHLFDMKGAGTESMDAVSRVGLILANSDARLSSIDRSVGLKGARVVVSFAFFNIVAAISTSEAITLFRGICGSPDEINEEHLRLTFWSRLNLQRLALPSARIQQRCPWRFPASSAEREEAASDAVETDHSLLAKCGYSADIVGGVGNLDGSGVFDTCDYTPDNCRQRGMFNVDDSGRPTRRFGGITSLPSSIQVRTFGENGTHRVSPIENEGKYNDCLPLVYGTCWYHPVLSFQRTDGNLMHLEVLLCLGEIASVLKVIVGNTEIPAGQPGLDMTATGWYEVVTFGERKGAFNPSFSGPDGDEGDPHGTIAALSVVVPNRLASARLPKVEVLVRGLILPIFGPEGAILQRDWTDNPAWILLDILRRCGWKLTELDLPSFSRAADYCGENLISSDHSGSAFVTKRYACNLALRKRRPAADIIRGVRNSARLILRYSREGKVQVVPERSLSGQQPNRPDGSNSDTQLDGGWPAYEFGDGSAGFGGILRRTNRAPSFRLHSKSPGDSPNRISVEFQDEFNEYQQASLSLVDFEDVERTSQETPITLPALGVANSSQAHRLLRCYLDKSVAGNLYAEFETSVKGVHLVPGDIITITYLREGLLRKPFRVLQMSPDLNFQTVRIIAQVHEDVWYQEPLSYVIANNGRTASGSPGIPRPLIGDELDPETGLLRFSVTDRSTTTRDSLEYRVIDVGFAVPRRPGQTSLRAPTVDLTAAVLAGEGTLPGGGSLYYAVSGVDATGEEGLLSFIVQVNLPNPEKAYSVKLSGLRFPGGAVTFSVYRGSNPLQLTRIEAALPIESTYTDAGVTTGAIAPPDLYFDHANFYWRFELAPEIPVFQAGQSTLEINALQIDPDKFKGMIARIVQGKGAGQERVIATHDESTFTLDRLWTVPPDFTSTFVICEPGWRFGSRGATSPLRFEVPNRQGVTVHILGRSANVAGLESALELSPIRRWQIGGVGYGGSDSDVPSRPAFGLSAKAGQLEVFQVSFEDLANTSTIISGTLTLRYWNELAAAPTATLAQAFNAQETELLLSSEIEAAPGTFLQCQREVLKVEQVAGQLTTVTRGAYGTTPTAYAAGAAIYALAESSVVMHFPREFFGSSLSGSYVYRVSLPNVRIAAADLFVTNRLGHSETARLAFTASQSHGLRTSRGGQYSLQVPGFLAIQNSATPPLVVEDKVSIRSISALVGESPLGGPIQARVRVNGASLCDLVINPGQLESPLIDGFPLGPLHEGAELSLDIVDVPQSGSSFPGRDLSVIIRL